MLDFWKSLTGMVEIELVSADLPGFLAALSAMDITLYKLEYRDDITARCSLHRKSYDILQKICDTRGDRLILRKKYGVYWKLKELLHRPMLVVGIMLFLLLSWWVPSRVFFIQVDGNMTIPSNKILEAAESCGIYFGASRSIVRSEKIKNALLYQLPQLKWAGVNTAGCVATISVREKPEPEEQSKNGGFCSIVAHQDGIIESVVVLRGNGLCKEGQLVRKGQTLISAYTDCGIFLQATRAEGEVFAQTNRNLTVITPRSHRVRQNKTHQQKDYSLLIGKKRINLWKDSGIWDTTCGRMYKEYYVALPGGFRIPLGIGVDQYQQYQDAVQVKSLISAQDILSEYASVYLSQQMIAGRIIRQNVSVNQQGETYILRGKYACSEMIGRVYWEQLGDKNGEIN